LKIELTDYNPDWIEEYRRTKELLLCSFGYKVTAIEHIGSTSVPLLGAKPIIDILLGVNKLSDADDIIPGMAEIGFEYISKYEDVMPERRYFVRRENGKNTHHVHSVEVNSPFWKRHLLFRDYLRTHDDVRDSYFKLKKDLSEKEWKDGNDFADAKTEFIRDIENKAKEYFRK
jgi:GrpB-like predicted nucleotidyltransferase (UPF0157 family)